MNAHLTICLIGVIVVTSTVSVCSPDLEQDQPKFQGPATVRADLVGTWVGLSRGDLFLYRIRLTPEGGLFGSDYAGRTIKVWPIDQWDIKDEKLVIRIRDGSAGSEVIGIRGEVRGTVIKLAIDGANWSHETTLFREADFESRLKKLRVSMDQAIGR